MNLPENEWIRALVIVTGIALLTSLWPVAILCIVWYKMTSIGYMTRGGD